MMYVHGIYDGISLVGLTNADQNYPMYLNMIEKHIIRHRLPNRIHNVLI